MLNNDSTVQELYTVFGLDPVNVKHLPAKAVRIEKTEQIKDKHVVPLKNVALNMFNQICKVLFPANSNWLKELVVNDCAERLSSN